jgi:hypothetical protein
MTMQDEHVNLLDIASRFAEMERLPEDIDTAFYAMTFTADENGNMTWATQSIWAGFDETDSPIEFRQARLVNVRMAHLWADLGQPYVIVRTFEELIIFLMTGGNALIEPAIAEEVLADFLKPYPSLYEGSAGFMAPSLADPRALYKAPSPKLRMAVLKRDGRRCRICGRSPDNHVDIELHVHHIRPWKNHGITDPSNLITLCHTCHSGLDPHFDISLFDYLESRDVKAKALKHMQGVENYRRLAESDFSDNSAF